MFPDIDEPRSAIGIQVSKYLPFIPYLINLIFGHRGLTHQFLFILVPILALIIYKNSVYASDLNSYVFTFLFAFIFGMLLHQIGDMLSGSSKQKGGIKDYFWPITRTGKYITVFPRFMRCVVWDFREKIYHLFFITLFLYQAYLIATKLGIKIPGI